MKTAISGVTRQEGGRSGRDGGNINGKLSKVNTRAVSRGQNKLIDKFKMATGEVIMIRGQTMEYMYIPIGIERKLVRFGKDCEWRG